MGVFPPLSPPPPTSIRIFWNQDFGGTSVSPTPTDLSPGPRPSPGVTAFSCHQSWCQTGGWEGSRGLTSFVILPNLRHSFGSHFYEALFLTIWGCRLFLFFSCPLSNSFPRQPRRRGLNSLGGQVAVPPAGRIGRHPRVLYGWLRHNSHLVLSTRWHSQHIYLFWWHCAECNTQLLCLITMKKILCVFDSNQVNQMVLCPQKRKFSEQKKT